MSKEEEELHLCCHWRDEEVAKSKDPNGTPFDWKSYCKEEVEREILIRSKTKDWVKLMNSLREALKDETDKRYD